MRNPNEILRLAYRHLLALRVVNLRKLHGLWEQRHLQRLFDYFDVDCVFDVGANFGQYATMLRQKVHFKGLIISFEPIPRAADHLRKISKNDPRWVVEELALSRENGTQLFRVMADSQFSSLSEPSHEETRLFTSMNRVASEVTVKTETLDSAFHRLKERHGFQRPFLKMDTQGFDVEVLTHGAIAARQFVGLQSELAVKKLYKDSVDFRDAIQVYERHGFALSAFVPNNAGHFPLLVETDCIMVRADLLNQPPVRSN